MANRNKKIKLWRSEEDSTLVRLVEKHEFRNWKRISSDLKQECKISRTPKQCRDRWFNNLTCNKNFEPFSEQEIQTLIQLYEEFGPQWSKISQHMTNRTESQLKNYMNATVKRNIRRFNKFKLANQKITVKSLDVLQIPEVKELLLLKKEVGKEWFLFKFLSADALMALELIRLSKSAEFDVQESVRWPLLMMNLFSSPILGLFGQSGFG